MTLTDTQMDILMDLVDQVAGMNSCSRKEALEGVILFLECGVEAEDGQQLADEYGAVGPTGDA